ncbi:MAG: low molecular weight protein-tyrosine-phosphatase [Solirubrobacteraceae bacterium]
MRLLFVCLGNICRSPTAEGVMRSLVREAGLAEQVEIDSAGTGSWHIGEPPDQRAIAAAERRGIVLGGRARQVELEDLERFQLIVAMDRSNLADLRQLAGAAKASADLRLLREFDASAERAADGSGRSGGLDVPDPYHGGSSEFDRMIDIVQRSCAGLLEYVENRVAPAGQARAPGAPGALEH